MRMPFNKLMTLFYPECTSTGMTLVTVKDWIALLCSIAVYVVFAMTSGTILCLSGLLLLLTSFNLTGVGYNRYNDYEHMLIIKEIITDVKTS